MEQDRLISVSEAARRLSVHRATLYRMIDRGLLVPVKLGKRATRFRESDIAAIIRGERGF